MNVCGKAEKSKAVESHFGVRHSKHARVCHRTACGLRIPLTFFSQELK